MVVRRLCVFRRPFTSSGIGCSYRWSRFWVPTARATVLVVSVVSRERLCPPFFPFPFSLPLPKLQLLAQAPAIHHLILLSSLQDRYCSPSWKRGTIKRIIQPPGPRAGGGMVKGHSLSQGWAPSTPSPLLSRGILGFKRILKEPPLRLGVGGALH